MDSPGTAANDLPSPDGYFRRKRKRFKNGRRVTGSRVFLGWMDKRAGGVAMLGEIGEGWVVNEWTRPELCHHWEDLASG